MSWLDDKMMDYETREKLKSEGWTLFSEAKSPREKAHYALHYICTAHYWRAREHLEERKDYKKCLRKIRGKKYYPEYKLDIDHYTENWLFSMKSLWDSKDPEIFKCLCEFYEPKESKYLKEGYTIYDFT